MLTPGDTRFACDGIHTSPVCTIVTTLELEGDVDPDHIRETLRTQILDATHENDDGRLLYPELGWTIKYYLGFPFWTKATLLEDPVRVIAEDLTQDQLIELQAKLTFQPYKLNAPLWELVLVRKQNNSGIVPTSIVLFRFHHTISDGTGIFHLLSKMIIPQTTEFTKQVSKKAGNLVPIRYLGMPYDFVQTCREGYQSGCLAPDKKYWTHVSDAFSPSEAISHVRFHMSEPIPFNTIRKLGERHGVTGTAVMHSAVLGALRSSFFPNNGGRIPSTITVETTVNPPTERNRFLGNNVTNGMYTAPIGEEDAVKRLLRTQDALTTMKDSTFSVTRALVVHAFGSFPRPIWKHVNKYNDAYERMFIGNLPGPEEKPNFGGYLVNEMSVMGGYCVTLLGLGVGLITFGDTMRIGVFGNRNLLSRSGQAEEITRAFMRELDELQVMQ
ncbi:hypothetical protein Fcan01_25578 [Folsomia candida]|uniref:O-acyltransferase WSD1 C-terminal domain-containing protein n=2 Tax=Folsomia candida TaxID=158441 RepID=A0A226D4A6_FOLCA|nr:hypothetical protein Fcan01_25578 [Folsomia candida]